MTGEHARELRRLHDLSGGWWFYPDDDGVPDAWEPGAGGPWFVTTDRWKAIYAARRVG